MLILYSDDIILSKFGEKDVIATEEAFKACVPGSRENTFTKTQEPTNEVKFLGAQWFISMFRYTFWGKSNCCIWTLLLLRKKHDP